jgi:chromosome segregation ATPase
MVTAAVHTNVELSRARTHVSELETITRDQERTERKRLHKELRERGREIEERLQATGAELDRLHDEASPLWQRMETIIAEHAVLTGARSLGIAFLHPPYARPENAPKAGPSAFASDEEIRDFKDYVKGLEVEFRTNERKRVELGGKIAGLQAVLERLKSERKACANAIERLEEIEAMSS